MIVLYFSKEYKTQDCISGLKKLICIIELLYLIFIYMVFKEDVTHFKLLEQCKRIIFLTSHTREYIFLFCAFSFISTKL